jgi:CubicO group peptidase (beta-lactamase class C family)
MPRSGRTPALPMLAFVSLVFAVSGCGGARTEQTAEPDPATSGIAARIRAVENGLVPRDAPSGTAATSLQRRMMHYHVPGVSIAVIAGGRIEWARAYGVAEAGGTRVVDTTTLFQAASISKVVTTTAALRLVERHRLDLDRDVNERLTGWKVPESPYTREQKVTLRRILTHTSGLTVSGFLGYEPGQPLPTLIQVLNGAPPANSPPIRTDTVPGSIQRYSGGGFTVAQLAVSEAYGQPFDRALEDLVLRPAGMVHSTFVQPLPAALEAGAASGHGVDGSVITGRWRVHPEQAAAGLWSTPSDLARLAIALQRAAAGENAGLLSPELAREMLSPQVGPSGLGFVVMGDGDQRIFRHSGSNVGFRARMVAFVNGGRGAVVMTNGDGGAELIDEIFESIARAYGWPTPPDAVRARE